MAQESDAEYSADVLSYLDRIYDRERQRYACRTVTPEQVGVWQQGARTALRTLIGLDAIRESLRGHQPAVALGDIEDRGDYIRQAGTLASEPHVSIPMGQAVIAFTRT